MFRVSFLIAAAVFLVVTASPSKVVADLPKKVEEGSKKLAGTWKVVSIERDGKETGETFKGAEWVFTETTLAARFPGEGVAKFAYQVRKADRVGTIDLEVVESARDGGPRKRVYMGIYSVEGDTLKICFTASGMERPKELATRAESGKTLFILKR